MTGKDKKSRDSQDAKKTSGSSAFWEKCKTKCKPYYHWLYVHNLTVWPLLLILCLVVTIVIGINTKGNSSAQSGSEQTKKSVQTTTGTSAADSSKAGSDTAATGSAAATTLKLTDDEAMNKLMASYYKALAAGDTDTISKLVNPASDDFLSKVKATSEYIDSYPAINVYTKPGPTDGSYLAYVYTEVQMTGYNKYVPGLATYYVCTNKDGSYYINRNENLTEDEADYIHDIDLEDDVVDLNNKVTAEFNNLVANDSAFAAYYTKVSGQITESVGTAQTSGTEAAAASTASAETQAAAATATPAAANTTVKATDVVNLRSSDSETADKVGKAQIGETFTLLETKNNGWSKVSYNGQEVYIKSQYLEAADSGDTTTDTTAKDTAATDTKTDTKTDTTTDTQKSAASLGADGYVTATTTVNIRKSSSESGEKLATVYKGTKLELVMSRADGWCKVKYEGKTGYVKSSYVE